MLIARQPIFNKIQELYGYELLYRELGEDKYNCDDDSLASSRVIAGSFFSVDYENIVGDKKVFIHFTEKLLASEIATLFSKEQLVVEMMDEQFEVSEEYIEACKKMYDLGYSLAFAPTILMKTNRELVDMATIIKIEINRFPEIMVKNWIEKYGEKTLFMATKVENQKAYLKAEELGFSLFQGYYFEEPILLSANTIEPDKVNSLKILNILNRENVDFKEVSNTIEQDVSFAYEILKLANSSYFYRGVQIESVRDAIVRLGINEIRKWGMIFLLRRTATKKQKEILNFSLVRAKFMEEFSKTINESDKKYTYHTVGLLSMIDVLLGTTMERVLEELHLSDHIKMALKRTDKSSHLSLALGIIISCEKGEWKNVQSLTEKLDVPLLSIAALHNEAIKWTLDMQKEIQ